MRTRTLAIIGVSIVALDHLTKWLAVERLRGQRPVDVIPNLFRLDYAENTGGAFSIMADNPSLLTLLSTASLLIVLWLFRQTEPENAPARLGLALIMAGAVANLIDRYFRGFVVDFLDAYWGAYHWPTFNIADTAICVGAGLFALFGFAVVEEEEAEPAGAESERDPASSAADSGAKLAKKPKSKSARQDRPAPQDKPAKA